MVLTGFAVDRPGGPLESRPFASAPLGDHEVLIRVTHCGVCVSDLDIIDDKYGAKIFPTVAGHEVVGVVEALGD